MKTHAREYTFVSSMEIGLAIRIAGLMMTATCLVNAAEVSFFSGGDILEGLDLDGDFAYAIDLGGPGGTAIRSATFFGDSEEGITFNRRGQPHDNFGQAYVSEYGDSDNDNALEKIVATNLLVSSPWEVGLKVSPGLRYRLQIIVADKYSSGWFLDHNVDLFIEDQLAVDSFPVGADYFQTAVISHDFTAGDDQLNLRFEDPGDSVGANAITLEVLGESGSNDDSDSDGLLDDWERLYFGDLSQAGEGDPDEDGLENTTELELRSNPANADSDGDGLADGAEVNDHKSDPLSVDGDGDGVPDKDEVTIHQSAPSLSDTDGDGFKDGFEIAAGSDPLSANSKPEASPAQIQVEVFTGPEVGQGLDLQAEPGNAFVYAINFAPPGTESVTVGGVSFVTPRQVPGIFVGATKADPDVKPEFGDSSEDNNLERLIKDVYWEFPYHSMLIDLPNPKIGARHRLQMLFAMQQPGNDRLTDVIVEGETIVDKFNHSFPSDRMGNPEGEGWLISYEFVAQDPVINIDFSVDNVPRENGFLVISALTLESIAPPAPPPLPVCAEFLEPVVLESPNAQRDGSFGAEGVSWVPDANGDGVADIVIGALGEKGSGGAAKAGRAYVFDGVTRKVLLELGSPDEGANPGFGWRVAGIEDLNGNGSGDVIVVGQNNVYVFDAATGSLIHTLRTGAVSVSAVPDVNGDGRPDIVIGDIVDYRSKTGVARIYDGANGERLSTLRPPGGGGLFGWSVSGVPDVNGDGNGDVIVGQMFSNQAHIFDGNNGELVHTLKGTGSFGRSVAGLSDVNADGRGDVVVGANDAESAHIHDGATGALLRTLTPPPDGSFEQFGWIVKRVPDVTGDTRDDVLVSGGSTPTLFDGATGVHLATFADHKDYGGGDSLTGVPDLNGDGKGEVLVANWQARSAGGLSKAGQVRLHLSDKPCDGDGDGMSDEYEIAHGLDPTTDDADLDKDADGLSNLAEFRIGTLANTADSDGDGLPDGAETGTGGFVGPEDTGSNPLDPDTDKDGRSDGDEVALYRTDPNTPDPESGGDEDFSITRIARNSETNAVTLRWTSAPGATYSVEMSVDLQAWQEFEGAVESGGNETSFTTPDPFAASYFRIRRR